MAAMWSQLPCGGRAHIRRAQDPTGLRRREGVVQGCRCLGMQSVQDHAQQGGPGARPLPQLLPAGRKVPRGTPLGALDRPPALPGLPRPPQMTTPLPALLIVVPHRFAWDPRQGLAHFADQVGGTLVNTDPMRLRGRRRGIQGQAIFHPPATLRARGGHTPCLFLPRLQHVCVRVRRTVSSDIDAPTRRASRLSASRGIVQHGRSSGGALHATALRHASGFPARLRHPPGRGRSANAASMPSSTTRLRVRSTVAVPRWSAWAIISSLAPTSAWSQR